MHFLIIVFYISSHTEHILQSTRFKAKDVVLYKLYRHLSTVLNNKLHKLVVYLKTNKEKQHPKLHNMNKHNMFLKSSDPDQDARCSDTE